MKKKTMILGAICALLMAAGSAWSGFTSPQMTIPPVAYLPLDLTDDIELQFGTGLDLACEWTANGSADDLFVCRNKKLSTSDTGAMFFSRDLAPSGMTTFDNYLSPTLVIVNDEGADANDFSAVQIGPGTASNVAAAWYFDILGILGASDGAVNATTTELTPIIRIGDNAATTSNSLSSGDVLLSDDLEIDGVTYPDGGVVLGGSDLHLNDDVALSLGNTLAAPNAKLLWETKDANANELLLSLPEGGATDVPVFVVGDTTALDKDLGLFDATTAPTIAAVDGAATKAILMQHDSTDGIVKSTSGDLVLDAAGDVIKTVTNKDYMAFNIPVSGADAGAHMTTFQIDGLAFLYASATGDGTGSVGANTINLGVGAAADVTHIGDANALVDITDAHWSVTEAGLISGENLASTDDADITDNLTAGDIIIDEAAGVLDFTGATSATITSSGSGLLQFGNDDLQQGSATVDGGTITIIKGAQTSDPQVQLALSADANGDFSITADTGDIDLSAASGLDITAPAGITYYDAINDGNAQITVGSAAAESASFQAVYDAGAQGLDYLLITTSTADATADEGRILFAPDESTVVTIDDGGMDVTGTTTSTTGFSDGTMTIDGSGAFTGVASIAMTGTITGVTTAITGTANNILAISVPDQPDAGNVAGVGLTITADKAGELAAGAGAGGSVTINAGDAGGSTGNANGGDITLHPGAPVNAGTNGNVLIPANHGLTLVNNVTEFSTDGTLAGNSDLAVPTEKAVKTYVAGLAGISSMTTFVPVSQAGQVGAGNHGNFPVRTLGTGETAYISFAVPTGFVSLTNAYLVVIPTTTGTCDWAIATSWGATGEDESANTDSATGNNAAVTDDQLLAIDISAAFTGIAAADYIGISATVSDFATTTGINVVGVKFIYSF